MKLTHCCIITENLNVLSDFYENVLKIEPQKYGDYIEFCTDMGILSLYDLNAHEQLAPGSAKAATNRSLELEFNVKDVDEEYTRLKNMNIEFVKHPTTQPWGNRSIYFRDPDGNLINFYCKVEIK